MRIHRAVAMVLCLFPALVFAEAIPDRNVNMVAGTGWPGGDPYLQRQNEPSIAVSTRNPLHLLAGANDYRTVDLPGLEDIKVIGDAWLGVFRSYDGGNTWTSTLLPGYPQDLSAAGMSSPLKGYPAGADPVVRAAANGLFYYAGITLSRDENPVGAFFVSRYLDFNDKESSHLAEESAHSIRYVDATIIQHGTAGQFNDKPWIAVDIPRPGSTPCTVAGKTIDGGNVYAAWTILVGGDQNVRSKMMVARSTNCGASWDSPTKLSETHAINQGASIAINPQNGNVYVVWRRITNGRETDALLFAKSTDFGRTFSQAQVVRAITPFEQGTTGLSFRTTAFPAMTVDGNGRIYIVWSERTAAFAGRVAMIHSADGVNWSSPQLVANYGPGHQFMPTISFSHGKLILGWYDQSEDHTTGIYTPIMTSDGKHSGQYSETRRTEGHRALGSLDNVFNTFIQEMGLGGTPLLRRHTVDVFVAQADPSVLPVFSSARASQYYFGSRSAPNNTLIEQMQFNPPNLPLFRQGTVPFFGDYLDIAAAEPMSKNGSAWQFNTAPAKAPVRHIVWTDNRDVRPPLDGNWRNYTPVGSTGGASTFDGTPRPQCVFGQAGMRNQNIYTTRVTNGLFAGSPGNAKPFISGEGQPLQRAFVVFVQNALRETKTYRLTIASQPVGGSASFLQFEPLTTLDVSIPARSSIARTVFATSSAKYDEISVLVQEITAPEGSVVPDGLATTVVLNPDIANPDIANPDIANPDIANPDIANAEVYNPDIANPDIANPDIANPDIANPDIANPDIANPDIANPDIANPDIANPDIANPDIANPDIANPDIANGSVTDTTWEMTNEGNTTSSYSINLLLNGEVPDAFKLQLILHRLYTTPVAKPDCTLGLERHTVLAANINDPEFTDPSELNQSDVTDASDKNATMWILPGETVRVTLRVVDPIADDDITFNAAEQVTPVAVAHAVNTLDLGTGGATPPVSLTITTTSIPNGVVGTAYTATLQAIGGRGARTWSAQTPLPAGLTLSAGGVVSGVPLKPTSGIDEFFTALVQDSSSPSPQTDDQRVVVRVLSPLTLPDQQLATATPFSAYSGDVTATGGVPPYTFALAPASVLPDGLTMSTAGAITGTPSTAGTRSFRVTATDSTQPVAQTASGLVTIAAPGSCALPIALDTAPNASKWFGGDDRQPTFDPRNVGTGQSITPTRSITLKAVEIPLNPGFSSAPCPTGPLDIRLDLRDANGAILATSNATMPCTFSGVHWVTFNISYNLVGNTTYNLTWWLPQGFDSRLHYGSPANTSDLITCGGGLSGETARGNDLSDWANWGSHSWDFHLRIQTEPPPIFLSAPRKVD